jgi:hypothetical protein
VALSSAPFSAAWSSPSKISRLPSEIRAVSSAVGSPSMPNHFFWNEPR